MGSVKCGEDALRVEDAHHDPRIDLDLVLRGLASVAEVEDDLFDIPRRGEEIRILRRNAAIIHLNLLLLIRVRRRRCLSGIRIGHC